MPPASVATSSPEILAEHAAVRSAVGLVDRSDHGLLEVTGRDRAKFLHAILSNDVVALAPGQGCAATLLDVHGKVQVLLRILALDDRLLVITPPELATKTSEAIDAYLFSEKAYFRDATGEEALHMLAGPGAPALAQRLAGVVPDDRPWAHVMGTVAVDGGPGASRNVPVRLVRGSGETGEPEIWLMSAAADGVAVRDAARAAGAVPVGRATFETLRIEAGTPTFPDDIGPSVLLPEVPFTDLVSYSKGCYVGQEVIVRIRDRGHVNRLLRGLVLEGGVVPEPGAVVLAASDGPAGEAAQAAGTEIGKVTSATWSPSVQHPIALAMVRRPHAGAGTAVRVRVGDGTVAATVADLPFARTRG